MDTLLNLVCQYDTCRYVWHCSRGEVLFALSFVPTEYMYSVQPTLRDSYRQKSPLCVRTTMNGVFFLAPRCYNLTGYTTLFLGATMVSHVLNYVREYSERLQGMPFVPTFSYGRGLLRGTSPCNSDHLLVPCSYNVCGKTTSVYRIIIFRLEKF